MSNVPNLIPLLGVLAFGTILLAIGADKHPSERGDSKKDNTKPAE